MDAIITIPPRSRRVLLVEPDGVLLAAFAATLASTATVEDHAGFETARERLNTFAPDLLVTNLQLGAFNGLHLVYLLQSRRPITRALVYTDSLSLRMAAEVQRAG